VIGSFCRSVVSSSAHGVLPLVVKDDVHSHEEDTFSYVSTYRLRKSFEFRALLSEGELHPNDVHPSGDLIVVDAPVSLVVEHFLYLTKKQLILLGHNHSVEFINGARKEVYRHLLLSHSCDRACTRTPYVFKHLVHVRQEASKPTYPSAEQLEQHNRHFIESRRH
jgi:hypothetical protein